MYLQIQNYPRIRGYDPLDMVSLIPMEEHPRIRVLQTKMRPNHFLKLLTKFLKILENIAPAFINIASQVSTTGFSPPRCLFQHHESRAMSQRPSSSECPVSRSDPELVQGAR